jgi:phage shock protein A
MKALRRLSSSVAHSFSWVISQIENHEALVEGAISDVQYSFAEATVQAKRIQKELDAVNTRKAELSKAIDLWKSRALQIKDSDQAKALECIKRLKSCEHESKLCETRQKEYLKLQEQLKSDLKTIEQKLAELKLKKNEMRSRQVCAEALHNVDLSNPSSFSEIDNIFERWEHRIMQFESTNCNLNTDQLEEEFSSAEEQEELKAYLDQLGSKN